MAAQRRTRVVSCACGDRKVAPRLAPTVSEQKRQRRNVIEMRMGEKQMVHARQLESSSPTPVPASDEECRVVHEQRRRASSRTDAATATQNPYLPHPPIRLAPVRPAFRRPPGLCHHAVRPIMTNPRLNFLALALYRRRRRPAGPQRLMRGQGDATWGVSAYSRSVRRRPRCWYARPCSIRRCGSKVGSISRSRRCFRSRPGWS